MMMTKVLQRLGLLLLLTAGAGNMGAVNRNIGWQAVNRIADNGDGSFTSAANANNVYALAVADLSGIDGIGTVGTVNIEFYCRMPGGSRWLIGIGDKSVRGTTANGSYRAGYNTDGLYLRFGEAKANNTFNVNGAETAWSPAVDTWLRVNFSYNREAHTYSYSLRNAGDNSIVYYSGTDVATSVSAPTIIEAYSWLENTTIDIHNVTVTFSDFYFPHGAEIAYIEDLSYTLPLFNGTGKTATYTFSSTSCFRQSGTTLYPKATTGSEPANAWEGDAISVTATADGEQPTTYYLRIKTRNLMDPASLTHTNSFEAGNTVGMLSSNTATLDGLTLALSKDGDVPVVRSIGGDYGVTIIDGNGYQFGNIVEGTMYGSVYRLTTTAAKTLYVTGYFSDNGQDCKLVRGSTEVGTIANPKNGAMVTGVFDLEAGQTYYLYAPPYTAFVLKSLSYTNSYFAQTYTAIPIPADGNYQQAVTDMVRPVYSIVGMEGEIASTGVTINSSTGQVSGITAGGALKIQATGGGRTCYYYLTVAYAATEYPGHQWNFCTDVNVNGTEVRRQLDVSANLKTAPEPVTVVTDSYGEEWRAEYKNGIGRDPQWYKAKAVNGDNAFVVKETNGLVFVTDERNFYLRNDEATFTHIGIRGKGAGASFTIPALEAGDIVELMWRHEVADYGSRFTVTNVTDLRGKDVDEDFLITESARRGDSMTRFVGYYSFIAKGGDVTFRLADVGSCDIQSVRIYKGPYRSTMRHITLSGNTPAPATLLLDNAQDGFTYNYCNQLYSTATGPAMYVLKGYRKQTDPGQTLGVDYDHTGCVTGANAAFSPVFFTDEDAYPVTDAEKTRLYELRKNLVGMEMYNDTWQSMNNSYNNGVIRATSGWGKVTIRMNNYTNDMKYVIGYTNDYTLTIGSAPHQQYPYTWDFTKIAGGTATGQADNVLYAIEAEGSNANFSGQAPTNWVKNGNGQFMLDTDNSGAISSQYVPGAVLVTQDKALSAFNGADYPEKYANDELTGLGFDGNITMHIEHLPSNVASTWNRAAAPDIRNSLLSFRITDYAVFTQTGGTEEEPIGTWSNPATEKAAGSGTVEIHANVSIDESSIPNGGIGCRLDDGNTKYIHLMPNGTLQAGDIITVTAYNAYTNRDAGVSLNRTASKTDVAQSMLLTGHQAEEELSYTVVSNDGLDGRSDFYLYLNTNTVHVTAVEITRSASAVPDLDWSIYTLTNTTITVPDLNAGGKQDWIYVSATVKPVEVTNAVEVTDEAIGSVDANTDVYKYKVTAAGPSLITFAAGTKIYKIGVTHILKTMHPLGDRGWATDSRDHSVDYSLTGYFTTNDANAYTVCYDSYDMETATVALTPVPETGYVAANTGIVLRQDSPASDELYQVPLFYPSYTQAETTVAADNMMVPVVTGGRQWLEVNAEGKQKFILTNVHWRYTTSEGWGAQVTDTDAAGFYRLHVWGDPVKDNLPDNCAYLGVPEGELPVALWNSVPGSSREGTLAIRETEDLPTSVSSPLGGSDPQPLTFDLRPLTPSGVWYSLDGRRLAGEPLLPGIYIHNGKKVIIK